MQQQADLPAVLRKLILWLQTNAPASTRLQDN
jgi:hypothetical protein